MNIGEKKKLRKDFVISGNLI